MLFLFGKREASRHILKSLQRNCQIINMLDQHRYGHMIVNHDGSVGRYVKIGSGSIVCRLQFDHTGAGVLITVQDLLGLDQQFCQSLGSISVDGLHHLLNGHTGIERVGIVGRRRIGGSSRTPGAGIEGAS